MAEIYNEKYAPNDFENDNEECNSSDDDIVSYITKQQPNRSSEFDTFLKVDRASALSDTLNWWKVSYYIIKIIIIIIIFS